MILRLYGGPLDGHEYEHVGASWPNAYVVPGLIYAVANEMLPDHAEQLDRYRPIRYEHAGEGRYEYRLPLAPAAGTG